MSRSNRSRSRRRRTSRRQQQPWVKYAAIALAGVGVLLIALAALQPKAPPRADTERMDAARASAEAVDAEREKAEAKERREASIVRLDFPEDRALNIFWAGDSLTAGFSAVEQTDGFRFRVNRFLEKWGPVEEYVATKPAAEPLFKVGVLDEESIPTAGVDLAVIELGTNDAGRTDEIEFKSQYAALIDKVMSGSPDAKMICAGAWGIPGTNGTGPYDRIIKTECEKVGGLYLDMTDLYLDEELTGPEGVETFAGPRDAFHPNDFGHEEIADYITSRIKVSE